MKTLFKFSKIVSSVIFAIILGFLCLSSFTFVVSTTDFSGKWSLDKEKSELGERPWADNEKIIKQTIDSLIIERKFTNRDGDEIKMTDKHELDGESINKGFHNSERKSDVSWSEDGKTLIIKSSVEFERDGEKRKFEFTEKYSLSEDEKTLTILSVSDRGAIKMIYNKK